MKVDFSNNDKIEILYCIINKKFYCKPTNITKYYLNTCFERTKNSLSEIDKFIICCIENNVSNIATLNKIIDEQKLFHATINNDVYSLKEVLKKENIDINRTDSWHLIYDCTWYQTPLDIAIYKNHEEIITLLLCDKRINIKSCKFLNKSNPHHLIKEFNNKGKDYFIIKYKKQKWTTKNHKYYPDNFKNTIIFILWINKKKYMLPIELLLWEIFQYFYIEDFNKSPP